MIWLMKLFNINRKMTTSTRTNFIIRPTIVKMLYRALFIIGGLSAGLWFVTLVYEKTRDTHLSDYYRNIPIDQL